MRVCTYMYVGFYAQITPGVISTCKRNYLQHNSMSLVTPGVSSQTYDMSNVGSIVCRSSNCDSIPSPCPGLQVPKLPQVPQIPTPAATAPTIGPQVIPQQSVGTAAISNCFMLSNMFDPSAENEPGWDSEIRDDVLEQCVRFGTVLHIHVDPYSQGNVYLKCALPQVAAAAFNHINGRFFAGE